MDKQGIVLFIAGVAAIATLMMWGASKAVHWFEPSDPYGGLHWDGGSYR